jgi:hypothetical protein
MTNFMSHFCHNANEIQRDLALSETKLYVTVISCVSL